MKKRRILSVLLALAMTVQLLSVSALAYPVPDYGAQPGPEKFSQGVPMAVSHRADWRNYPENSLLAIQSCIDMGVDVVELDVKLTSDGVVVLSHDSSISRCTGVNKTVSSYTWEELREHPLKNNQGSGAPIYTLSPEDAELLNGLSGYAEHVGEPAQAGGTMPLTRLDDAIELIDHQAMINLDHCFNQDLFVACYVLFRETDMLGHVFFKNSAGAGEMNNWYKAAAEKWNELHPGDTIDSAEVQSSILYVYILSANASGDTSALQSHLSNGDNLVMVEVCIGNDTVLAAIEDNLEPWCMDHGIAMFVNTMWSGLCGTLPDTQTTWAKMLMRGYTAIQTDRPGELTVYLQTISQDRSARETIEAEHFNAFNGEDHRFSVSTGHDDSLNKYVERLGLGDWLCYENVVFEETASMLAVQARGLDETSYLQLYLDGMKAEDRIATVAVGTSKDYQTYTAELTQEVPEGSHTLYLQAQGVPGLDLVSLDSFTFQNPAGLAGDRTVEEISVLTEAGEEPLLPGSVTVTCGEESYTFQVRWEQIPQDSYAQAGEFTVLGYVSMLQDYVKATVTVQVTQAEVPADGLIFHADATRGVEADEAGRVSAWTVSTSDGEATAAQAADGSKPILVKDGAGGVMGIRFDGANDYLSLGLNKDYFNGKSAMTAVLYAIPEQAAPTAMNTNHNSSALYLGESGDWGGMYLGAYTNGMTGRFGTGTSDYRGVLYQGGSYVDAMTALIKDGSTDKVWINGESVNFTSTGTAAGDTTRNINGAALWFGRGKNDTYWKGTLCEVLIYDRVLSDDELRGLALELEAKYSDTVESVEPVAAECAPGQAPQLPGQVEVRYASGRTGLVGVSWEPIHPRNYQAEGTFTVKGTLLTGHSVQATVTVGAAQTEDPFESILLWFSAQNGVVAGEDGKVSAWSARTSDGEVTALQSDGDKMPALVADGEGNVTALRFDGNDVMTFTSLNEDHLNGYSGMTAVVYSAPEGAAPSGITNNHNNSLLYFNEKGSWGGLYLGTYTNGMTGRFGTGTANNRGVLYDKGSYAGFTTTVLMKDGSTDKVIIDGAVISDFVTAGAVPGGVTANNNAADGKLGAGKANNWTGAVSEIMIFDHALTDQELEQVYRYLNDTYGEQTPAEVPEDGLLFWMDSSQGLTVDDQGRVKAWASRVNDLTATYKTNTKLCPVLVEDAYRGVPGVRFEDGVLQMPMAENALNGLSGVTAIVVAAPDISLQNHGGADNYNAQRNTLFYVDEAGDWGSFYVGVYTDLISARFGTGAGSDYGIYGPRRTANSGFQTVTVRWDGSTYQSSVDGAELGTAQSKGSVTKNNKNIVYLGAGKDGKLWKGTLCEILLYDRALSDEELRSVNGYLALKYASDEEERVPVTGIYLTEEGKRLDLFRGDSRELEAVALPMQADEPGIEWTTTDPSVATVDETGVVTAVGLGSTAIVATTREGGFRAYCTVRVTMRETERLWQDIETLVSWARRQDPEAYDNWADVDQALEQISALTEESPAAELKEAYAALRGAILALEGVELWVVTFDARGGSSIAKQEVVSGTAAAEPTAPTRSGYRFSGWYTDEACAQKYDFSAPVTGDLTLYAGWVRNSSSSGHTHRWSQWTVTVEPDSTHEGERSRICQGCGRVEIEVIPMETELSEGEVPLTGLEALNTSEHFAYIKGFVDGTVRPLDNITRAEVVAIFYRIMGREYRELFRTTENPFPDVTPESWYNEEVSTAVKAGLIKGLPDGTFGGGQEITRAEFVAIAARLLGPEEAESSGFTDIAGHWAEKDIHRVAAEGWVQGKDGGIFDPDASITRAEVMAIVNRILGRTAGEGPEATVTWSDNPEGTWYYQDVCLATSGPAWSK